MTAPKLTRSAFLRTLPRLGACKEAMDWCRKTKRTPAQLWAKCPNGAWMGWLLYVVGLRTDAVRAAACECASLAMELRADLIERHGHKPEADEIRVLAVKLREVPTRETALAVSASARAIRDRLYGKAGYWSAVAAAAAAAAAADAAAAAAADYAADRAAYAAAAAAAADAAAAAARKRMGRRTAAIIRKHVSARDVARALAAKAKEARQ